MTREEHLQWAKDRALEYVATGSLQEAVASMVSDLSKHEEMNGAASMLMSLGMREAIADNALGVRRWIEGFN